MTSLKSLQSDFQKAILEGDDTVLGVIPDSAREQKETLLGVYRNAYVLRLIEFLQTDYEKLHAYLGDDQFAKMASAYAYAVPSNDPNGRWFGARLPEFLAATSPYSERAELAELAFLERALNDVFDAAEVRLLSLDDLALVAPEEWGALTFRAQPATRALTFETNAVDIWTALHGEKAPPQARAVSEPVHALCYRQERQSKLRVLPSEEALLWHEAQKGTNFAGLCEICATYGGEDGAAERVAGCLQGWIATGLLAGPDTGG